MLPNLRALATLDSLPITSTTYESAFVLVLQQIPDAAVLEGPTVSYHVFMVPFVSVEFQFKVYITVRKLVHGI